LKPWNYIHDLGATIRTFKLVMVVIIYLKTLTLLVNYVDVPNDILGATVDTNRTRKDYIANMILKKIGPRLSIFTN